MRVGLASLRTRILGAILAAIVVTDLLAVWIVNDRILNGARREADSQARAHTAQVRALYQELAATLSAEAEAVALYPAVITALADGNAQPLLLWSGQVAALQHTGVTVVDATGRVVARGHAPEQRGDDLASGLEGLRLALDGRTVSGAEDGDELGLALRASAPVSREGRVVGAIMLAKPFDDLLLVRLVGGPEGSMTALHLEPSGGTEGCTATGAAGACRFELTSPSTRPVAALALTLSLADVERGRADAQQTLAVTGAAVLLVGGVVAWLLARSLTRPLVRLTEAAGQVASGAYGGAPLDTGGADEIGVLARAFEVMRERVGVATGALADERDVLDAVLQSAGDGILMVGRSGAAVVANRRWSELLGAEGGIAAATELVPVVRRDVSFATCVGDWLADPTRVASEDFERLGASPAAYRRFRCYTAPVRRREGTTIGRILVLRDVTLESEAERMRTALVSNVSHELRSPLTSISGYVETLLQGGPWEAEEEREFLEIIGSATDRLARLVDNLLDAAKTEVGVLTLEREPVRVERLAEHVVAHRRPLTPHHDLQVDAEHGLPIADADPMRVEQILTNLVDNAIKYSPAGGPIIVRVRGSEMLAVSVTDQGIGIAADEAERLFERFYRVDSRLARTTKGLGLGLFICKSLVEAHGGRIWVESGGPGRGSTFSFTLPRLARPRRPSTPRPAGT